MTEDKEKLFAQYWGQLIMKINGIDDVFKVGEIENRESYILLTPLSMITDEDLKQLGFQSKPKVFDSIGWQEDLSPRDEYKWSLEDYDYLRSKGYALPWNSHTVAEMVEAGWIKLKEA